MPRWWPRMAGFSPRWPAAPPRRSGRGDLPRAGSLDLGPGVAQRDGAVEDRTRRPRVDGVGAEVAVALELVAASRGGAGQARLELAAGEPLQRGGIEDRLPVLPGIGLSRREEVVVETHLGVYGVGRGHPVEGAANLPAVGGVAPARGGVVGDVHLDHLARGGIALPVRAANQVGVAQAHL